MSFETDNKEVSPGRTLYTGVTNVNVIACNPSNAEMVSLGINPKNMEEEPTYRSEKSGTTIVKFLIQAKTKTGDLIKADVPFFIGASGTPGKNTGKFQYVDEQGRFKWLAHDENNNPITDGIQFFDIASMQLAYKGEEDLTNFLRIMLNIKAGSKCVIDSIATIFETGNVQEIKDLLTTYSNKRTIGVLLGVKESEEGKHYQITYTKAFERSWSKDTSRIMKKFKEDLDGNYISKEVYFGLPPYELTKFDKMPTEDEVAFAKANDSTASDLLF